MEVPIGQIGAVQVTLSDPTPGQAPPPFEGGGLLQSLVRVWNPNPQLTEQEAKLLQAPQLPSEK